MDKFLYKANIKYQKYLVFHTNEGFFKLLARLNIINDSQKKNWNKIIKTKKIGALTKFVRKNLKICNLLIYQSLHTCLKKDSLNKIIQYFSLILSFSIFKMNADVEDVEHFCLLVKKCKSYFSARETTVKGVN